MTQTETERRQFNAEQKFKVVKEALTTDTGVSGVCKKYGISTSQYYRWQEQFLSSALEGFNRKSTGPTAAEQRRINELEADNQRMKDVISEIVSENIVLKKRVGD